MSTLNFSIKFKHITEFNLIILSDRLICNETGVCVSSLRFSLFFFSFFFQPAIVDFVNCEQCIRALFMVPQITLFSNFFIKNGSHSTIYTFKNYFATVFSVSIFSFSKNKFNPNTLLEMILFVFCWLMQSCLRIYIYFGYKFFKLVMQTCN